MHIMSCLRLQAQCAFDAIAFTAWVLVVPLPGDTSWLSEPPVCCLWPVACSLGLWLHASSTVLEQQLSQLLFMPGLVTGLWPLQYLLHTAAAACRVLPAAYCQLLAVVIIIMMAKCCRASASVMVISVEDDLWMLQLRGGAAVSVIPYYKACM